MRIDAIGLRTALLAGVAGWALLAWLLALAGMGTRVELLGDDAALRPALPALPATAPERLGEFARYAQIAAHPVFAEDRQPHPFFLAGNGGNDAGGKVRLTGVLITGDFRMATLTTEQNQSLRLRLGDAPQQGWRLLALEPRRATVEGPGGTQVLELAVFDGKGGTPPTALAGVPAGAGGSAAPAAGATAPAPPPGAQDAGARAGGDGARGAGAAAAPGATTAPAQTPAPGDEQLRAIRERIEARRRQLREQQQRGAASSGQNP
jgi:general secretion pathway protein N